MSRPSGGHERGRSLLAGLGLLTLLAALAVLPHHLKYHQQDFMIFLTVNVLVVVSYRLVTLTGEWSLIHAVMMGVGAYASAMLAKFAGVPFWLSLPLAGVVAGLVALLLCFPLFRMTQFYFLIGSFAAGEAIRLCWIHFIYPFGGTSGISGIPPPELAEPVAGLLAGWFGPVDFIDPIPYYYLVLTIVSVCLLVLYRIERSRVGLTLQAVHWKAPLAESVGIDTWHYRSLAFVAGSFFVGLAGALKVHYLGTVTPNQFDIDFMVFILIWVIVGGYATFFGAILGAVVLSVLDENLRGLDEYRPALYGLLLIAAVRFLPQGLESLPARVRSWRSRPGPERPRGATDGAGG